MHFFAFIVFLLFLPAQAFSEEPSPDQRRTEQGYEVTKDNYLNIPSDMRIQKVAGNVITTEPEVTYLSRKVEELNQQLALIKTRLDTLESRMQALES